MRLMAIPVLAVLLSCGLWSLPASAGKLVKNTMAHPAASARTASVKTQVAEKSTKTRQVSKTNKAAKSGKPVKAGKAISQKEKGSSRKVVAAKGKSSRSIKPGKPIAKAQNAAIKGKAIAKPRLDELLVDDDSNAVAPQMAAVANDSSSERVYEGLLPTPDEKILMSAAKDQYGRTECVQLLKTLMAAPRTLFWREGRKLKASWDKIKPGTAIATFKQGEYPQQPMNRGNKHAAIFLRATAAGIYVFDQFVGREHAEERFIPWRHPRDKRAANNASAYSTVRW